jgi:LysM repeat protein
LITEQEKFDFDSVPEFVREPRANTRETYNTKPAAAPKSTGTVKIGETAKPPVKTAPTVSEEDASYALALLPKTAELEALWPGVNHDFIHGVPKKGPSFYLCIGFMAGAIVSMAAISGYSLVTHMATNAIQNKEIVVSQSPAASNKQGAASDHGVVTAVVPTNREPEVVIPLAQSYEVGSGDTLAAIALKNYKRATPRLLDEICKANNMRNADVLNLGQKLVLPDYRPQSRQIASGATPY